MPATFTASKKKFWASEAGLSGGGGGRRTACVPKAAFSFVVNPPGGNGPFSVQFTDESEPCLETNSPIVTWGWTFNDGSGATSPQQSPFYTFPTAGTFPVALQVTDGDGKVSNRTLFVTVPQGTVTVGPTAVISQSQVSATNVGEVTFEEASTPGDSPLTQVTWNFGNGTPNQTFLPGQPAFQYTYPNPGPYTVTLTVTDLNGLQDVATVNVVVPQVVPQFELTNGNVDHPYNIRIDNTTTYYPLTAVFTFTFFEPGPPGFTNPVTANQGTVTSVQLGPLQSPVELQLDGNPIQGNFGVLMTVTDTAQGGATIGNTVRSLALPTDGPVASFTWGPTPGGGGNQDVTLTSTASPNPATSSPIIATDWFISPFQGSPPPQWTPLASGSPTDIVLLGGNPLWIVLRVEDSDNFITWIEYLVTPDGNTGP